MSGSKGLNAKLNDFKLFTVPFTNVDESWKIEVKKLNKIILDPNTNIIGNFDYFEMPLDEFWKIFNSLLELFHTMAIQGYICY